MPNSVGSGGAGSHRLVLLVVALVVAGLAQPAASIPAFARKYGTSCHTCHTVYPKLNPFGNAFRLRGYRMPGETEEMIKQEPVQLGAEANKRLWPKALWPSTIPSHVPLSLDLRFASVSSHDAAENATRWNDLKFPEEVELLAGGTFDESISYFAELEIELEDEEGESHTELEIGHAEVHFNGPWNTGTRFNVKLGRFVPELTQQLSHGYLAADSAPASMLGFNPVAPHGGSEVGGGGHHGGDGGISLPGTVDGIEVYGILAHRFDYSLGVANGIGPGDEARDGNEAKDYFARIGYKLGGLSLDGEGEDYVAGAENWREKSLRVGVFAYEGDGGDVFFAATGHHGDELIEDREFSRYGVDLNAYYRDVNLIVGYVRGEDTLATYTLAADDHGEEEGEHDDEGDEHGELGELVFEGQGDFDYEALFVETDVVFYPWLHGALRYEWLDPANVRREEFERFVVSLSALVRANVKAQVEYREDTGGERKDDYEVAAILRLAF